MTTQTLTSIVIIAVLIVAVFVTAFRLFKTFYLLKEVKTRLNLETEQKEHYKKKLAASPTRQEFIEQSEMATSWRQKHDALEVKFNDIEKINNELHADNVNLESEIDRANEFITEARSIMQRQRLIIEESHWDFDELAKFAEHADKTGTISEYLKVSRRNILRTPAPIHLFPNSFSTEPTQGIDHQIKSTEGEGILTHNDIMKHYVDLRMKVKNDKTYSFHEGELDFSAESIKGEESHVDSTKSEEILMVPEEDKNIDWSEPQPFPKGYKIPVGLRVVAITNGGYSEKTCVAGDIGTVVTISPTGNAFVIFDGRESCNKNGSFMYNRELIPLDPTDHPLHPEFNPSKYEA